MVLFANFLVARALEVFCLVVVLVVGNTTSRTSRTYLVLVRSSRTTASNIALHYASI